MLTTWWFHAADCRVATWRTRRWGWPAGAVRWTFSRGRRAKGEEEDRSHSGVRGPDAWQSMHMVQPVPGAHLCSHLKEEEYTAWCK